MNFLKNAKKVFESHGISGSHDASILDKVSAQKQFSSTFGGGFNLGGGSDLMSLLSGQTAKYLTPIIRFIAVQKTSPVDHWQNFFQHVEKEKRSEAYTTLIKQISFENRRQQNLIKQLRQLRSLVKRYSHCITV